MPSSRGSGRVLVHDLGEPDNSRCLRRRLLEDKQAKEKAQKERDELNKKSAPDKTKKEAPAPETAMIHNRYSLGIIIFSCMYDPSALIEKEAG